jgi:4-hydroxyphenylacetate 3-monooxygenase
MPCRFPSKKNTSPVDSEVPETKPWLDKHYTVNEGWVSEDRRKLLAFARDLPNSDKAGHRLALQLFAQSAPFANLAAVHRNFDWDGPCSATKAGTK